ncbi:hypothetical protein ABXS75_15805 [Roseburia hominis]
MENKQTKLCKYCQMEIPKKAKVCPNCKKKQGGKLKWIVICVIAVFIIAAAAGGGNSEQGADKTSTSITGKSENKKEEKKVEKQEEKKEIVKEHYELDLRAGNYIAGKDIPVGTYNLTATAGSGNVSSSNMYNGGLNEVMGVENDGFSQQSFNGLKMEEGVVLTLGSTVVIHMVSEDAQTQEVTGRTTGEGKPIDLQAGNYTAGTDFSSGTYKIVATGTSGNVSSSNMYDGGLNEIMGADGFGITEFANAVFPEGTTLTISGTTVQLVPVGE